MNVLDLVAKLSLDSSAYDAGLSNSKSLASKVGNGIAGAMKVGIAAIGAATTAVGAFAASSVNVGQNFDKSMSQVAATMGKSTEEIKQLRDFAQEMGRTTAFSATQAADALNYMALAGYDATTSMEMLPNVLNLAAAGSMDLARASDMITDTQTAFGISLERTSQMVDEMAKAASTGNTSVEQLGEAFLTVGGLAQELNGGMVKLSDGTTKTVDGVQELEIALTAMANAGIKGSEAGTHMRNMLLKLSDPTDAGTKALEEMGVKVFDTDGKMRSLADVFGDLSDELDNMTQEQKISTISDLFNTRDLASAEALLKAVGQDWDKIGASIIDSQGAAQKMAETQLDNLAGDVTLFKSALEGAQIAVSDKLTPTFRDFVKFGTNGLSQMTDAFVNGGLDDAISKFGFILSDGITMIIEKAPEMVSAGVKLLASFIKGFTKNKKKVGVAIREIMKAITDTIGKEFPSFKSIMDKIQKVFDGVFGFIKNNGPLIQGALKGILAGLLAYTSAITVFNSLQKGIALVRVAIKALNGELAMTALVSPYVALAAAIGVVIGLVVTLEEKERAEKKAEYEMIAAISEETEQAKSRAHDFISAMNDMYESNMKVKQSVEEQIKPEQDLIDELKTIVDENGKVKEGYEERAQVITGMLSDAFGIEIENQNGVIQKYGEVMDTLDQLIEKKKAEAILDASKEKYAQELADQITKQGDMRTAQEEYNTALEERNRLYDEANEKLAKIEDGNLTAGEAWALWDEIDEANLQIEAYDEKLGGLKEAVDETSNAYYQGQDFIADYNNLLEATTTGAGDVNKAITDMTNGIIESGPQDVLKKQVEETTSYLQSLLDAQANGAAVTEEQIQQAIDRAQAAVDAFKGAGQDGQAGYAKGLEENSDIIEAAKKMVDVGLTSLATEQDSHSPSKEYMKQGIYAMSGYGEGMLAKVAWLSNTVANIVSKIETPFKKLPEKSKVWGGDMMKSFIKGIEDKVPALQESITKVANTVKDNLGHSHPKEGPLADDYTWMPDMMELFAKGIKDNEHLITDQITNSFGLMEDMITPSSVNLNTNNSSTNDIIRLLEEIAQNREVTVILQDDADAMFRIMQRKSKQYKQTTGNPSFA